MCKNITLKNFYSPKYVVKKTFQLLQVSTKLHSKVFASIIFPCSFLVFGKQLELKTNSNIRRPTPTLIFLFFFYVFFLMSCLLNPPPLCLCLGTYFSIEIKLSINQYQNQLLLCHHYIDFLILYECVPRSLKIVQMQSFH